jgi:23S rRNA pseudouridine2605 synthase
MEPIRLQKYLTDCGVISRRAAEKEITAGNVSVNGIPAVLGQKITPGEDAVTFRGKPVLPRASEQNGKSGYTYILLNKPVGYVTTMSDDGGRKTVADLIRDVRHRSYPVGRLDLYSDGLLLCTDDGEIANRLLHPSHEVPKQYLATLNALLTEEDLEALAEPFELDGYMLRPFGVDFVRYAKPGGIPSTVVRFTLWEGRNREIRRICAHYGVKLSRLTRIAIGKLSLKGIPSGKWRELTSEEIEYLKSI